MSHSLNEVSALAVRAARGAGFDWGMAEEAGFAVRWLCAAGLPGALLLAQQLKRVQNSQPGSLSDCSLSVGVQISDRAQRYQPDEPQRFRAMACPLLLMPFLSNVASQRHTTVSASWSGQRLRVSASSLLYYRDGAFSLAREMDLRGALDPVAVADVQWALDHPSSSAVSEASQGTELPVCRAQMDSDTQAWLSQLAARTYAPATENSRRLGAGGAD